MAELQNIFLAKMTVKYWCYSSNWDIASEATAALILVFHWSYVAQQCREEFHGVSLFCS